MHDYTGIKCPHCDIAFQKNDDIVVCPDCGAPYHRHCYEEIGQCLFTAEHASGKEWKAPEPPTAPDSQTEIKDKECVVCGTLNPTSALFCNRCGSPLIGSPDLHQNRTEQEAPPQDPQVPNPQAYWGTFPGVIAFDLMGGVNPTETVEDNVTFGEISKLVKQNTAYYMPRFRFIKHTRKNKFNLSAFLFGGPWMLYRKMYKRGAILTFLQFALYLAYIFTSIFISTPAFKALMQQAGVEYTANLSLSSAEWLAVTQILSKNPALYWSVSLPLICLILLFFIMLFNGFTGNKAYLKHCVSTAKQIKQQDPGNGDTSLLMEEKGGVNLGIAVCMLACYMIVSNIPMLL